MILISVDFPLHFRQRDRELRLFANQKSTSSSAWTPGNDFDIPCKSKNASVILVFTFGFIASSCDRCTDICIEDEAVAARAAASHFVILFYLTEDTRDPSLSISMFQRLPPREPVSTYFKFSPSSVFRAASTPCAHAVDPVQRCPSSDLKRFDRNIIGARRSRRYRLQASLLDDSAKASPHWLLSAKKATR